MIQQKLVLGIIIPQFPSYTETFFLSQVIGLCERGYTVNVFCNSEEKDPALEKIYRLKQYNNLKIIPFGLRGRGTAVITNLLLHPVAFFKGMRNSGEKLKKELYIQLCKTYFQKYKCHIYHFGYSGVAISYLSLLDYLPGKIVVSCLGTAENVKPFSEPERVKKLELLFSKATKIHCVSAKMKDTIERFGAQSDKIFINRPAIDGTIFSRATAYNPSPEIQILSIGRLVFQKGFLIGIMAIAQLVKKFNSFKWIIVGEGPELEEMIFTINLMRLDNHVKLAGKKTRDEVLSLYQTTDIFFLPSVSEGIANVVLEAMSMQIPVVASNSGGASEVITNEVNGLLCNNYDFDAMAAQLEKLCNNYQQRKSLGEAGRKTIEAGYLLERYIDVFESEYHAIAG